MKKNKKLILVELNELNFDLIKLYSKNEKFNFFNKDFFLNISNSSSENKYEKIEPWIQWVSVHTGLTADEHKVFRLGEVEKSNTEQIFEKVEKKGFKVGAICPMNVKNNLKNEMYFLPDPWTKTNSDKSFINKILHKTLSDVVKENSQKKISLKNLAVLFFSFFYFFRIKKYFNLFKMILASLQKKWYKALILDHLIHEIHLKYIKKLKPDFSTIFFNAGAHIQHHYLFNSNVVANVTKNPDWYLDKNHDPLLDAIKFYDNLLNDYLKKKYDLLILTGLTQKPYDRKKFYYRLKKHRIFFNLLNISYSEILERMSRDFDIVFENSEDCDNAFRKLLNINNLNYKDIFFIEKKKNSLFVSLIFSEEVTKNMIIRVSKKKEIKFYDFVSFVALKNGMHDQKGFIFAHGDIKNFLPNNNVHISEMYNTINSYFAINA